MTRKREEEDITNSSGTKDEKTEGSKGKLKGLILPHCTSVTYTRQRKQHLHERKKFFCFSTHTHTHIKRTIHVHFYKFVLHKRLHEIILKTLFSIFCIFSQQFMRFKCFGG